MSVNDDQPETETGRPPPHDASDARDPESPLPALVPTQPSPSASSSLTAMDEEGESLADRAWRAAAVLGEMGIDVTRELAHALGPSSPYHRHDFLVIAFAVALVITGGRCHRDLVQPSTEIDEHSTRIRGERTPESSPSAPAITERTSSHVETMQNTTSQLASSASVPATLAPYSTSGSALARVRFQIVTAFPDCARRFAISKPIRPAPIQPMLRVPVVPVVPVAPVALVALIVLIVFFPLVVLIAPSPCCPRTDLRSAAPRPETAK